MNIRKANLKDIENNLLNIYIEGFKYHYNGRSDIFSDKKDEELKNDLINTIKKNNILILENNEKIIGYIVYEIKEKYNKIMWIDQLVIDINYRHNGYGKILMDKVKDIAILEKCQRIEFNCWSFNKNAIDMYKHLGFKEQKIIFEIDIL